MAAKWPCVKIETPSQCVELVTLVRARDWDLKIRPRMLEDQITEMIKIVSIRHRYHYAYLSTGCPLQLWPISTSEPLDCHFASPLTLVNSISALSRYATYHLS
jgi:hypothetical protein